MKKPSILSLSTLLAIFSLHQSTSFAGDSKDPSKGTKKVPISSSADVVKGFFSAFGKGDAKGVVESFHAEAKIIAVRDGARTGSQVFGTYLGRDGAKAFVSNLGRAFDTQAFQVDQVISQGETAFASGTFVHVVKATGKKYESAWALKCVVKDGLIREYHFYEDSAAFDKASS